MDEIILQINNLIKKHELHLYKLKKAYSALNDNLVSEDEDSQEDKINKCYKIIEKMSTSDHKNPSKEQRDAKWFIYDNVISKRYSNDDDIPRYIEPDAEEGWKSN